MRAEIRHPLAYCASALAGESVLKGFAAWQSGGGDRQSYDFKELTVDSIFIGLLLLPFWIPFSAVAARFSLRNLLVYMLSGATLGVVAGTFYGACVSGMLFVSDMDEDFIGRGLQLFRHSGVKLAVAGSVACACYWRLAIRGRASSNAPPLGR